VTLLLALACGAAAILATSWVGYPVGLWIGDRRARQAPIPAQGPAAPLSAVIVTRDDPTIVRRRVNDLVTARDVVIDQVVVVVDHAATDDLEPYRLQLGSSVQVVRGDAPGGKAAGLNAGIRAARHDLVMLADSWQTFRPDAVARLVDTLRSKGYQAVSGRVSHAHEDRVMRAYWRYENFIRTAQARSRSVVTTSGAITLVSRAAWAPLPAGVICDDLFMCMAMAMAGHRVGYDSEAIAIDPRDHSQHELFQKKVRTLTGLWQLLRWKPDALVPWKNPVWLDLLLHKVARLATPPLVFVAVTGFALAGLTRLARLPGSALLVVGAVAVLAAVVRPRLVVRVSRAVVWACWLLIAPIIATYNGVRGRWGVWAHHAPRGT
jgi:cellulose synthase/poly-beta-1,6-N-acetylglucosamine synthase-like glycosyltransferase